MSPPGQAFLYITDLVLQKPSDQEVVVALLNTIGNYFKRVNVDARYWRDMQSLSSYADELYANYNSKVEKILTIDPFLGPQLKALISLSLVGETLVDPIFGMTNAIGTVMRKKIEPVVKPIAKYIRLLQSQ